MSSDLPPGWPPEVQPPSSGDFKDSAVAWLLDVVPDTYRDYDIFRRWPPALALLAHYHAHAVLRGHRQGYRIARTELGGSVPAHAMDSILRAYCTEGERFAAAAGAVDLVARALFRAC
jgi:hypothetical protein